MPRSNRTVYVMVALGVVLGLGIALSYQFFLAPEQQAQSGRNEITTWAASKWKPLRTCLVGAEPLSSDARDAITLRAALAGDELPDPRECMRFFGDMSRPGKTSSGNDAVEKGWRTLQESISKLANAYVHFDYGHAAKRVRLSERLAAVDGRYAEIRAHAGMDPWTPPGSTEAIATLPPGPMIEAEGKPIMPHAIEAVGDLLVVSADIGGEGAQLRIKGSKEVEVVRMSEHGIGDASGAAWGIWVTEEQLPPPKPNRPPRIPKQTLHTGPTPISKDTKSVVLHVTKRSQHAIAAVFALSNGKVRIAVYQIIDAEAGPSLVIARSRDAGATWTEKITLPGQTQILCSPAHRRCDLVTAAEEQIRWIAVDAEGITGKLEPRILTRYDGVALPTFEGCHAPNGSWWLVNSAVIHAIRDSTAPPRTIGELSEQSIIVYCDSGRVLARDGSVFSLCDAAGCKTALEVPNPGGDHVEGGMGPDGPFAVTLVDHLLLVWRGGAEPDIYRLSIEEPLLIGVATLDGAPHAFFFDESSGMGARPLR